MSWLDRGFLSEFISLYEHFPELWNIKSEEYHNKQKKQKAYEKLVEKLKEVEVEATIDSVKRKINSLRCNYRRELKKIKSSARSGAGADEIYVSSLWYFEDLYFLNSLETQKDGVSSLDLEEEASTNEEAKPPKKKARKLETAKQNLLTRAVESLEKSSKPDEAAAVGACWEALYRNLDARQKLYANKVVTEALFQGALGNLDENTYKAVEAQCTRRPNTLRSNSTTSNFTNLSSTPLPSPIQISDSPCSLHFSESQTQPTTNYTYVPQTSIATKNYAVRPHLISTPLPSPDQFSSDSFTQSQPDSIIQYTFAPQTSSRVNNIQEFFNTFDSE